MYFFNAKISSVCPNILREQSTESISLILTKQTHHSPQSSISDKVEILCFLTISFESLISLRLNHQLIIRNKKEVIPQNNLLSFYI